METFWALAWPGETFSSISHPHVSLICSPQLNPASQQSCRRSSVQQLKSSPHLGSFVLQGRLVSFYRGRGGKHNKQSSQMGARRRCGSPAKPPEMKFLWFLEPLLEYLQHYPTFSEREVIHLSRITVESTNHDPHRNRVRVCRSCSSVRGIGTSPSPE